MLVLASGKECKQSRVWPRAGTVRTHNLWPWPRAWSPRRPRTSRGTHRPVPAKTPPTNKNGGGSRAALGPEPCALLLPGRGRAPCAARHVGLGPSPRPRAQARDGCGPRRGNIREEAGARGTGQGHLAPTSFPSASPPAPARVPVTCRAAATPHSSLPFRPEQGQRSVRGGTGTGRGGAGGGDGAGASERPTRAFPGSARQPAVLSPSPAATALYFRFR